MCEFCGNAACTLTKQQVVERGAILESNAYGIMRLATEESPQTYSFKGVPAFYSLSALIPDEDEESPHAYLRFVFDEDEGAGECWEEREVENPLAWQTEQEFIERFESAGNKCSEKELEAQYEQ